MGFNAKILNADVMAPYLAEAKIAPTDDVLADATKLQAVFNEQLAGTQDAAMCDCGGISNGDLPACPFCGDAEDVLEGDQAAADSAPAPADPEPAPVTETAPQADEPAPVAKSTPPKKKKVAKKKPMPKAAAPDAAPTDADDADAKAAAKKAKAKEARAAKAAAKKAAKAADAEAADAADANVTIGGKAPKPKPAPRIVTPAKAPATIVVDAANGETVDTETGEILVTVSEAALEKKCKVIRACVKTSAAQLVKMGEAFKEIHESESWKARLNDGGHRAYTGFAQFCRTEFGVSASYAMGVIRVIDNCTTAEIHKFGMNKCKIAVTLPKDQRAQLLTEGANDSRAELSDRAKALKAGAKDTPAPKPTNPVTVAVVEGMQMFELQARSGDEQHPVGEPTRPATALDEDPWCMMELENNTRMVFRVQKRADGRLQLHVETTRLVEN